MKLAKRYIGVLIACFLLPLGLFAQTPTLKVNAPNVVGEGERFQLAFEIDVAGFDNFTPPTQWDNVNVIAGPSTSTMRSSSYVNGQATSTTKTQIIYLAVAEKEGKIVIGEATIEVDGKTYKSAPKQIDVVKDGGANTTHQQPSAGEQPTAASADDLFIRINVSKSSMYKGDHLIATLKIYTRNNNLRNLSDFKPPVFNGFYSQELEAPSQIVFQRENVNGKIYDVAVLYKYLLYPQHAGTLKIEPFETTVAVIVPAARSRSLFDDMFAPQGDIVHKKLVSPQVNITVKDLPSGAPMSFSGAVGDFKLETSLSKDNIMANNAIIYTTKISGTGNFKLFTAPKPTLPADFEVYDPKTTENLKNSGAGLAGSQNIETTVIPRSAGSYTIPPTEFTYFNPSKGEYITLKSKEHLLTVERDPNSTTSVSTSASTNKQQDIRYVGEDIRSNKLVQQSWRAVGSSFFCSMTCYSIYILAIVLFVVAIFVFKERERRRGNVVQMRTRKANSVAKKRLSLAGKLLKSGNIASFYEEVLKASWGYLSDKFNMPVADLSRDNIREVLSKKNVEAEDVDAFIAVVDDCEFARYAPGTGHTEMEHVYNKAINVISKLEQKTR